MSPVLCRHGAGVSRVHQLCLQLLAMLLSKLFDKKVSGSTTACLLGSSNQFAELASPNSSYCKHCRSVFGSLGTCEGYLLRTSLQLRKSCTITTCGRPAENTWLLTLRCTAIPGSDAVRLCHFFLRLHRFGFSLLGFGWSAKATCRTSWKFLGGS